MSAARSRKRWGRVAARPSEYLILLRGGRLLRHGPGLSVFLWPWHSYSILPTTIQRVSFVADQVTAERVGVEVRGVAVYRLADPLLAFRMLDFSEGSGALQRLAEILRDMFIGAARRLVANMTVEDCMTRRKESIASELLREIQPVVSGLGRPDDATAQGWGVVLDTIEIQDVRVLSETVFAHMQAPYRAELELRARRSQVDRDDQVHRAEVQAARSALEADLELKQRRNEAEEQAQVSTLEREQRVRVATIERDRRIAEAELQHEMAELERDRERSDARHTLSRHRAAQQHEALQQKLTEQAEQAELQAAAEIALEQRRVEADLQLGELRARTERTRGELEVELARLRREVENMLPEQRVRYEFVVRALPALAQALAASTGSIHLTQVQSDGKSVAGPLAGLVAELLAVGRAAGVDLPGRDDPAGGGLEG